MQKLTVRLFNYLRFKVNNLGFFNLSPRFFAAKSLPLHFDCFGPLRYLSHGATLKVCMGSRQEQRLSFDQEVLETEVSKLCFSWLIAIRIEFPISAEEMGFLTAISIPQR